MKQSRTNQSRETQSKQTSWRDDFHFIVNPQTKLARFLMWINLPGSIILYWVSWMNGVIPWPTPIQEFIPHYLLWPTIWWFISISVLVWLSERWEAWYAYPERNRHDPPRDGRLQMSLAEELPFIFNPQTRLARLLMWINLPGSTIFCWVSLLNGVIPWPTPIQDLIPNNPLWPSIWYIISISLLVWLANRWEAWYADSNRNTQDGGSVDISRKQVNEKSSDMADRMKDPSIAESNV